MSNVRELSDNNFETTLTGADRPVLVDFSATWCQPCKALAPTIDAVAKDYDGRLDVYKVDIDQAPSATSQFGISGVPTCIFFRSGKEAAHVMLAVPFALSGGVILQKLLGYEFNGAVWVGYIALFGTAVQSNKVWPEHYGVLGDYVPNGFWKQVKFPFVWKG